MVAQPDNPEADRLCASAELDALWKRKLDEVVALSTACHDTASVDDDQFPDPAGVPSLRIRSRTTRALEDLTAIEDAMARVDDGTYGRCTACRQRMPAEWLAEEPQIEHCPDCALTLVAWNSSRPSPDTQPAPVVPLRPTVSRRAPAKRTGQLPPARPATVVLPLPA